MTTIAPSVVAAAEALPAEAGDQGLDGTEAKRWLLLLGVPFIVGGALFAIGITTGKMWMLGPASLFGPGAIILGFTYLALTSDTNRR
jgi:hypothetical protein